MPPGRNAPSSSRKLAEAPLTEYDKTRAQTMIRNNQVLQRLGVSALASILNNTSTKSKGGSPEDSGSLYDAHDSEDSEHEEVDKVPKDVPDKSSKKIEMISATARASKRVVAPEQQEQCTRVTRQKTRVSHGTSPDSLEVPTQHEDDALISDNSPHQHEDQIQVSNEGAITASTQHGQKGRRMGRDLDRLCRSLCTKMPIHISEGKRRPEVPIQAAKLATEGGIIIRHHIPILPHWKEYKKNESHLANYIGKVAGQFTIDTNSKAVKHACADLLKGGQRQMRYRLKKKYFDGVPANQVRTTSPINSMTDTQWRELVEMWSSSKHKDKCLKNQLNREKVQFQQRTGSRSYIAQAHVVKQEKYKDVEPTAIDLFKDFHCSNKNGFSEPVRKAIADMEGIMAEPVQEGHEPKSATEVVSQVLPSSSTFLQNVGLQLASNKSTRGGVSLQVQELQAELETEKQEAAELRQQIDVQQQELENLKRQAEESETAMAKQSDEIESLKKTAQETNALLRQLLSFSQVQVNPTP